MKGKLTLCLNCLTSEDTIVAVEVGPEQGSQRDPWREELGLCIQCGNALIRGDLAGFHSRYAPTATIVRSEAKL